MGSVGGSAGGDEATPQNLESSGITSSALRIRNDTS